MDTRCTCMFVHTQINSYNKYSRGASHLAAGLASGWCALGGGFAVGISGDHGIRALGKKPQLFVGMVLIWAWAQVRALYIIL
jgi:F0F1-type ATP synthase membrane subunit c/vacuolar-type H+-ATPase subunit K